MVDELVDDGAGLEQVTDDLRRGQVVVHGVVAALAEGLDDALRFGVTLRLPSFGGSEGGNAREVGDGVHQLFQALLGGQQGFVGEVDGAAVVGTEHEEADGHRRVCLLEQRMVAGEELLQRDEVVVRLTHLLAVDGQHIVVHPVLHGLMTHRRRSLGYLALVVGEDEVQSATVDVEHLAEVLTTHGRTLAVPAGETVAPGRRPAHDVLRLCLLPQGEVGLVMLLADAVEVVARGVLDVLQGAAAEDAVLVLLVIRLNVEIDRTVRLVGKAVVENLLHQLLLLDDVARGMRLYRGAQHVQRVHILMVAVGVVLRYLHRLQLFQTCLLGYLVLALVGVVLQMAHVGDVTHVPYFITEVLQVAEHQVEGDGGTGMAQMGVAIDGGTTDIHTDIGGMERFEALLLTRQRIVNNKF